MDGGAPLAWTRRDVLRTLGAAAGLPALDLAASPRRRVGIIGGGMAGVALAWLLDGERDVVLLEARDSIGGNVQSVEVDLDGQTFVVDMGAQYFHPGPYPLYTALLAALGLYTPGSTGAVESHVFPASITLTADAEPLPRFVSPVLPQRVWPLFASWNQPGVLAFATAFAAAKRREDANADWALTLQDWLPTLGQPLGSAGLLRAEARPGASAAAPDRPDVDGRRPHASGGAARVAAAGRTVQDPLP